MLEQMVESRENYGDGARRGNFLLTTMVLVVAVFASGMLWSLFAKDLGIGEESLELSSLVAPVVTVAEEPPAPEPPAKERNVQAPREKSELPSRRENILQINETPIVPKDVSTAPLTNRARPKEAFMISESAETDGKYSVSRERGNAGATGTSTGINQNPKATLTEETDVEPPTLKKPTPTPTPKIIQRSIGVINGKATSLPKPPYPPAAQAIRAGGDVSVQVTIDETGRVVSAKAVSGHPLLKAVSEAAARNAKFDPTTLSNTPVKVTGVIVYKFTAQ